MMDKALNVGSLVKTKSHSELKKIGIRAPPGDIPFMNDVGIVVRILDSHVVVLWQRLGKEGQHFPHTLEKIAD